MSLTKKMGDKHEEHLAEVYGGRVNPGSGNQWNRQTVGRVSHRDHVVAFARDGKSTCAQSISIKSANLNKHREQCLPERPMLPIRFYDNQRLTSFEDWVLLAEDDMLELLDRSDRLSAMEGVLDRIADLRKEAVAEMKWVHPTKLQRLIDLLLAAQRGEPVDG